MTLKTFTVILGSAYEAGHTNIFLIAAPTAKDAGDYCRDIEAAIKDDRRSVLFCIEGEAAFCPTLFNDDGTQMYDAPKVIDLRQPWSQTPVVPVTEAHALDAIAHGLKGSSRFLLFTSIADTSLEAAKGVLRGLGQDYQTRGLTIALPIPAGKRVDKLKRTLARAFGSGKLMGTEDYMIGKMTVVQASDISSALANCSPVG